MPLPWQLTGIADAFGGRPILLMMPHAVDARPNVFALRGDEIAPPSGARAIDTAPAAAVERTEFEFLCETHAERAFLEAFFDARRGKAEGFWFPTWQWEFDVHGYDTPNFNSYRLWVAASVYGASIFPLGAQFRQLLLTHGDAWHLHTIASVASAVSAGIDRFAMTGPLAANSTPDVPNVTGPLAARDDSYRPLWLRYGRFDQDELVAESINSASGSATITLAIVELPEEVPT